MTSQRVLTILGATGSVGANTLDVVARHPYRYRVAALTAQRQVQPMLDLCARFHPRYAVMVDEDAAQLLRTGLLRNGLAVEVLAHPVPS